MPWVSILILVPLVASVVLMLLPATERRLARGVALVASFLTLAVSIVVLSLFDDQAAVLSQVDHLDWIPAAGVSWDVGVDGISIWLVMLTTVIFTLGIIAACQHLPRERASVFLGLIMMAQAGLLGLFTAGDLILFYVFWEFMLIPFALLIWNWGGGERRSAGMIFVVYTMVGSLLMLVSIVATGVLAADQSGSLTFLMRDLMAQGAQLGETTSTIPTPMLNTRSISACSMRPSCCTQGKTAGTAHESRCSTTCTPAGTMRARFSTSPPPVMCAMPCTTCLTR